MHKVIEKSTHLEVVDSHGKFVESFDFNEIAEVKVLLERLNVPRDYAYELLIAKGKWTTIEGKKMFIPIEEFYKASGVTTAMGHGIAQINIIREYKAQGYIVRNLELWHKPCERQN